MEPWMVVLALVLAVPLLVLRRMARRRVREAAAESARRSGRKPTAAGAAAVGAFFSGSGLLFLFLDGDDDGRRGVPDWVAVPVLVACGLYFFGVAVQLRRKAAAGRPSGGEKA